MIKQLIFKNETLISALIVLCILVFSFVLKNQSTLSILILLILMFVTFLSLFNFRIGVLVLASSSSLNGFVRMHDLDNPITAGFVFLLVLFLLSILLIIFVSKNKHTIPKAGSNFVAMYVLILCLLFIYIVSGSVSLLSFILYLREYFVPLLVFFIFFHVLKKDLYLFNKIIIFIVLPAAIVAIVNIYHYFFELDIVFNQYVGGNRVAIRSLFGFQIPRLSHILGLGGEAAGGLFYILLSILSLLVVKHQKIFLSILLFTSSAILALASILTVSSSVTLLVLSFVFWLSIFKLFHHPSRFRLLIFITVVPFLLLILFYPFGINEAYDSIFNYAFFAFIGKFLSDFQAFTLLDHIFGIGLSLPGKGGELEGAIRTRPDLWIFSLYVQFGLIGFVMFLTFWAYPLLKIIFNKTKLCENLESILFICGFIIIGSFTSAHGVAIFHRLFTPILMLAFATFYVYFYVGYVKKISRRNHS